jgi:hypothetical protein
MGLRWAWRLTPEERAISEAIGMSRRKARRAVRKWVQPEPLEDVQTNTSGMINFHWGLYGVWPSFHWTAFGTLQQGAQGEGIGYAQGILFWKANQPQRPLQNFGPWVYNAQTTSCVRSFKTFFAIPNAQNGQIDPATWQAIQWCAWNITNRSV